MFESIVRAGVLHALLASCAIAAAGPTAIPPAEPVPAAGANVVADTWAAEMTKGFGGNAAFGTLATTEAGVALNTLDKPEFIYSLQAQVLNVAPIAQGDAVLARFAARSVKAEAATGATRLKVGIGKASAPWTSNATVELGLSAEWQRFDIPFASPLDFAPGEARFVFNFGYTPQQVEIADVTLLDFGKSVPVASLPKTKRFAAPLPEALVSRELTRIAQMRDALLAVKDPSPANGKTVHVAVDGVANGPGDAAHPFQSIPRAIAAAKAGDTVLVHAGDYREPLGIRVPDSGKPDAWLKIKAAPGVRPRIITSSWSGFDLREGVCYVEINGFELDFEDEPTIPSFGCGVSMAYAAHHIRIVNNVVHDYGTGGIISLDCDYLTVEGNTIYNTSKTSPYGGSAISLCRAFNFDDAPGYHNVVRRNVCYDNANEEIVAVTSGGNGKTRTDGNGIIIDCFNLSRANPFKPHSLDRDGPHAPYTGRTLIENNVCYDNGGRGVHVFRSSNVDVINNTCYWNQYTPEINGGEFTAIESSDMVIANNIGVSRPGKRVSSQDGSTGFILWTHDLLAGTDALRHADGLFDVDPMFAGAPTTFPAGGPRPELFRLKPGSPAIGKGLASIAPRDDVDGKPRPTDGAVDLGAYQLTK